MQKRDARWGKSKGDEEAKRVREMAAVAGWIATARLRSQAGRKGNGLGRGYMRDVKSKREGARGTRGDTQGKECGDDIESRKETGWPLPSATMHQVTDELEMSQEGHLHIKEQKLRPCERPLH